jgi:hypothetical protein
MWQSILRRFILHGRATRTPYKSSGNISTRQRSFFANPHVPVPYKLFYTIANLFLILMQLIATAALHMNVAAKRCGEKWTECDPGMWCLDLRHFDWKKAFCVPCGGTSPPDAADGRLVAQGTHEYIRLWMSGAGPGNTFHSSFLTKLAEENSTGVSATQGLGLLKDECDECYSDGEFTKYAQVVYAQLPSTSPSLALTTWQVCASRPRSAVE